MVLDWAQIFLRCRACTCRMFLDAVAAAVAAALQSHQRSTRARICNGMYRGSVSVSERDREIGMYTASMYTEVLCIVAKVDCGLQLDVRRHQFAPVGSTAHTAGEKKKNRCGQQKQVQ